MHMPGEAMFDTTERFLCIASDEKGHDFLRQCAEMGVRPTLLTLEKLRDGEWPREALEDLVTMPSGLNPEQILNTVSWMARGRRYDRIVALGEFDTERAAQIREHMRIPGMGTTTAGCYRDKLAMRVIARALGFAVPAFCRVLNYDEIRDFMARVPTPWLLKPRTEASVPGVRRIDQPEQLWRILDDLGDEQSRYILEQFVPGDIFHVESIVSECEVQFQIVHRHGGLPMKAIGEGGVFTSRTVDHESRDAVELTALNKNLAPALGMVRGVIHAKYIKSRADGRYCFLEISACVGGALISDLVEVATGVNLWREWARLEVSNLRCQPYRLPDSFETCAGSVHCLARTADAQSADFDMDGFDAPEIALRVKRHHDAGLIVRSENHERVKELLDQYSAEFARRFLATVPLHERLMPE
jgi:biotin carboxylase